MPEELQFNKVKQKPLVIFSLLDWGYGHTTRSIPLIACFLELNCSVTIACNETQERILKVYFPAIKYVNLPGYSIHYGKNRQATLINLILQIPSFLTGIRREHAWLLQYQKQTQVNLVVSDNRYGFFSKSTPSVVITHQLGIRSGKGLFFDVILKAISYSYIKKFTECWIPDQQHGLYASGALGHPKSLPGIPIRYIGCLSRFNLCNRPGKGPILIVLSGPEPQRTILEEILLPQLAGINEKVIFVRGLASSPEIPKAPPQVTILNFASGGELNELICDAKFVISRCGYTTVMDLLKTKKKSILIPTPGQAEQEYLSKHLYQNRLAFATNQKNFNLRESIDAASKFSYQMIDWNMKEYKKAITHLVERIL